MQHERSNVPDAVEFMCIPSVGEACPTADDFRKMGIIPTPLGTAEVGERREKPARTATALPQARPKDEELDSASRLLREIFSDIHPALTNDITLLLMNFGAVLVSSGAAAGVYQALKTWVDARNGRKLKIKVGDIEVEATQMKEEDVLHIFELLQEKADEKKIRELLLKSSRTEPQ